MTDKEQGMDYIIILVPKDRKDKKGLLVQQSSSMNQEDTDYYILEMAKQIMEKRMKEITGGAK